MRNLQLHGNGYVIVLEIIKQNGELIASVSVVDEDSSAAYIRMAKRNAAILATWLQEFASL